MFLTATVVAALFAGSDRAFGERVHGLVGRAGGSPRESSVTSRRPSAPPGRRTRIAREMHDIVAHSLSVVITLADAASVVSRSDPDQAAQAMQHASDVGRQALSDMRTMIGVLRTEDSDLGARAATEHRPARRPVRSGPGHRARRGDGGRGRALRPGCGDGAHRLPHPSRSTHQHHQARLGQRSAGGAALRPSRPRAHRGRRRCRAPPCPAWTGTASRACGSGRVSRAAR